MKEKTLRRIEQDIVSGDYGKARDRLHGLLGSYPHDLSLRRMLGDIYWHLQYPVMAGRYWYLEEEKTPAMSVACAAFERSCGSDPVQILLALKFKADLGPLRGTHAGQTLVALQAQAKDRYGYQVEFGQSGRGRYQYSRQFKVRGKVLLLGLLVALAAALGLMVVGLATVLQWLF
jgi:hypothetical protein